MRIGIVDFLNAYPLCYGLEDLPEVELIRDIPSRLSDMICGGELDAALISSIEYHRHRNLLDYIPDLCISSRGEVYSILLFVPALISDAKQKTKPGEQASPVSPAKLAPLLAQSESPLEILYDRATRSSLEILKILLKADNTQRPVTYTRVTPPHPQRIENLKENQLLLLIGDEALQNQNYPAVDIGSWYEESFRLPAIYALWAIDKNKRHGDPTQIILSAWEKAKQNPEEMIARAARRFHFPEDFTRRYLTEVIHYEAGSEEKEGLNHFFQKYDELESP